MKSRKRLAIVRLAFLVLVVLLVRYFPEIRTVWEDAGTPAISLGGIRLRPYPALGTPHFVKVAGMSVRAGEKPDGISPGHVAIVFVDPKTSLSDEVSVPSGSVPDFFQPNLRLFSVAEYEKRWASVTAQSPFADLRATLAQKPLSFASQGDLPKGFFVDAHFRPLGPVRYVKMKNGEGFVVVTEPVTESHPIDGDKLYYVFQGLARDSSVYVLAIVAVKTGLALIGDQAAERIGAADWDTFSPPYKDLERMFRSIAVSEIP